MTREELAIANGDILIADNGTVMRHSTGKRIDLQSRIGYWQFKITHEGRRLNVFVHRAVWVLANGPIPAGLEINHKDENKSNNRLSNLELKTHRENILYSAHKWQGESHSRFTEADVIEMRRLHSENVPLPQIAAKFGATIPGIWKIVKRINWKHLA